MKERTLAGQALTDLILDIFRLNSRITVSGDKLVANLSLTSARWQILGTIVEASQPKPVAWLARDLGSNRQNVQRIVNELQKKGLVVFEPNPNHKRAQLVVLTNKGKKAFETAMRLQIPWANELSDGLLVKDIKTTHNTIRALCHKLENDMSGYK